MACYNSIRMTRMAITFFLWLLQAPYDKAISIGLQVNNTLTLPAEPLTGPLTSIKGFTREKNLMVAVIVNINSPHGKNAAYINFMYCTETCFNSPFGNE